MRMHRERKQTITVEFGLFEARELAKQIRDIYPAGVPGWAGTVLSQFRERLEWHVAEAEKGNPRV